MTRSVQPRILMYHSIHKLSPDPNGACTSPSRFQSQMHHLKQRNLRGVSLRELRRAESLGEAGGLVGLTFDDAYEDFLKVALPVLESFGFSATVFVVSGLTGRENEWEHEFPPRPRLKLLSADGVREVSDRGMEIGAHGVSHIKLGKIEPDLLREEIEGSRRDLHEVLGREVEGFCYPYGSLDGAAIQAVQKAGYEYACAVAKHREWDNYSLPRIPVSEKDNIPRFAAKLSIYPQYESVKGEMRKYIYAGRGRTTRA